MKIRSLIVVLFVILLFNSCSNKIDLYGNYEENASVFAMLDPSQPIQFVKINKVFTSPDRSAYDVAKVADSLYFDSIAPFLTVIETGRTIPLFKYGKLLKDLGIFATSPNYLYATEEKIYASDPNKPADYYHYRIDFDLPSKKKHISAVTNIPDSVILLSPINVTSPFKKEIDFFPGGSLRLTFQAPTNSRVFDAYFYFNYQEMNKLDTNIKVKKFFKFRLIPNYRTNDDYSHEQVSVSISTDIFYDFLLAQVKVDTTLVRRFLPCKLELTGANQEYDNYAQATEPSIGIVQKQTEYSNVKNGIGLFAARRTSRYNNIAMGLYTRKLIVTLPEYSILGFVKS